MDEKTQALRDIFIDVAEQETVTERQEESPGTLTGDESRMDRVRAVISELRERHGIDVPFDDDALIEIAQGYFDKESDEAIAAELEADTDADAVMRARLALHLVDDADRERSVDLEAIRGAMDEETTLEDLTAAFDAPREELDRARSIVTTEQEMRRSNYRFRDELRALLGDGDLSERLTEAAKEDGLADATDGLETNTSF